MIIRRTRFNTIFQAVAAVILLAVGAGCSTSRSEKKKEASIRFYLEANLDGTDRTQPVSVGRSVPFALSVESRAFLTEFNVDRASVINAPGGFVLSVQFDREGTWILEQYSTAHKTKRVAIAAEFGELRWIAAPIMRERITNGHFVFTPDTSREEAEKIANGVNRVAELVRKGRK